MFENGQNNFDKTQFDEMSVSGVDNVTKKKGKKAALIGGVSAAVIVGGSAAAYGLSDTVKNQVKLRLSKPEKYYAWINEKNTESLAEMISEKYKKALDGIENGKSVKLKFSYAPSDEGKDKILEELIGSDYSDTDDKNEKQLIDIVNKHDEYALSADISSKQGKLNTNFGLDLSGEQIMSFEAAADMEAFDFFLRVPELKEQWLSFGIDVEEKLEDTEASEFLDIYKDILKDPASFLTPEELEKEINRYADVWNNFSTDVELEKKQTVDICDISVDYTVTSVDLSEKDIAQLSVNMLEKLRDDKIAKRIIVDKLDAVDEDEYVSKINDSIDDIKADIEDDVYEDDVELTVETYIDFTGTIRGMKFLGDDDEIFMAIGEDDGNVRGALVAKDGDDETFSAKLVLNDVSLIKKNQDYTGYITINSEDLDDEVKVEFSEFKIENEEKLCFNGDIVINIPDVDPIKFTCKTDGKKEKISYDLRIDGTDYGKLALEYAFDKDISVDMPEKDGAYIIDIDNADEFELEDYVSQKEFSKFIDGVLADIGFTGDTAKELANDITEDIYDEVEDVLDDDDDYDWDDDFDWDDDDDSDTDSDDFKTSAGKDDKNNKTDDDYDDDLDIEFSNFDWDSLKYEDYKDFMTKEEFDDFVNEMKEYAKEYQKAS